MLKRPLFFLRGWEGGRFGFGENITRQIWCKIPISYHFFTPRKMSNFFYGGGGGVGFGNFRENQVCLKMTSMYRPSTLYMLESQIMLQLGVITIFPRVVIFKYVYFELKMKKYSLKKWLYLFFVLTYVFTYPFFSFFTYSVLIVPGMVSREPKGKRIF